MDVCRDILQIFDAITTLYAVDGQMDSLCSPGLTCRAFDREKIDQQYAATMHEQNGLGEDSDGIDGRWDRVDQLGTANTTGQLWEEMETIRQRWISLESDGDPWKDETWMKRGLMITATTASRRMALYTPNG
eukprot:scaffold2184_cov128-Cylindrotheca_fusiformis.AAC.9